MKFAIRFWLFSCAPSLAAPAPDQTQRAWLQSAGAKYGGPLMDGGDFEQHRRLPQRLVDRYGSQQRFLH